MPPFVRSSLVAFAVGSTSGVFAADTVYLFTYFTRNGEDGLHLAWSEDGYKWEALDEGRSYLAPKIGHKEKLMRDPCIAQGPDGTWHLVWTSGWNENHIGYASTRDFVHWSEQRELPVMAHEPGARNSWAPEIVYDAKGRQFVIFWASTIPGRFHGAVRGRGGAVHARRPLGRGPDRIEDRRRVRRLFRRLSRTALRRDAFP